jgi:putative spermidine/putrescine transport system substrate-binding protein
MGFGTRTVVRLSMAAAALLAATFAPGSVRTAGANDEVVALIYGGTLEHFMRHEIAPAFEKKTGIKVRLIGGHALGNYAKVVATRSSPEYDVYWSNELTHAAGKQLGLYEKIDTSIVKSLADAIDEMKDPDGIGAPTHVFATGIAYNEKALAEAGIPFPTSWHDLWDPRLKGRIALYTMDVAFSQDFLAVMSRLLGGNEKNIGPAVEKIKQLKTMGNVTRFASSAAEIDNLIVQGQAWVTVNGSPRAALLRDKGAPVGFTFPKEGAVYFANYMDVIKNAPHPKAAQLFVEFMMGEEAQPIVAKGFVARPANKKVPLPESLKGKVPDGDDFKRLIKLDRAEMNRQLDRWTERWDREIMGGH